MHLHGNGNGKGNGKGNGTGNGSQPPRTESSLNELAREAICAGRVPLRAPDRMFGGDGGGESCAVCECPVQGNSACLELEFRNAGGAVEARHFHVSCYAAWVSEFLRLSGGTRADKAAAPVEKPTREKS